MADYENSRYILPTAADEVIPATAIVDDSITATQIATDAVDSAELKDNAVTTNKILDANVTNSKLASNSVTNVKVSNGTIVATDKLSASGTKGADTFLAGDNTWKTVAGVGFSAGSGNLTPFTGDSGGDDTEVLTPFTFPTFTSSGICFFICTVIKVNGPSIHSLNITNVSDLIMKVVQPDLHSGANLKFYTSGNAFSSGGSADNNAPGGWVEGSFSFTAGSTAAFTATYNHTQHRRGEVFRSGSAMNYKLITG